MTSEFDHAAPFGLAAGAATLTAALAGQRTHYAALLVLAHREEAAIVATDVAELTRIVDEKETLIEHINALETERVTALVAIAAATGIDAHAATLSQIATQLDDRAAAELMQAGMSLRSCAELLREADDHNALLLRASRDLVERWIVYLRSVLTAVLYNASGNAAGSASGARAFDRSA